jgi:hypothetical protein
LALVNGLASARESAPNLLPSRLSSRYFRRGERGDRTGAGRSAGTRVPAGKAGPGKSCHDVARYRSRAGQPFTGWSRLTKEAASHSGQEASP